VTEVAIAHRYRLTVDQYHQMADAGVFALDCRVELVDGEIFELSPIGPWHSGVVDWLVERFVTGLAGRAIVRAQNPTGLDLYSEPQPDVMLVAHRAADAVEVFRDPSGGRYRGESRRAEGKTSRSSRFPISSSPSATFSADARASGRPMRGGAGGEVSLHRGGGARTIASRDGLEDLPVLALGAREVGGAALP
jgi:hypothetical protein